jgi:hypothetical protein
VIKKQKLGAGFIALLMALATLPVTAASAGEGLVRTTWPSAEDPGAPIYARVGEPTGPVFYNDGVWAAIVFYRDPGCIPPDFNLLEFFAFDSFGCDLTVSGFTLWEVEPGSAPPKIHNSTGSVVPVWFVPLDVALAAAADGILTIGELAGLEGLRKGVADRFNETLRPIPFPPELGGGGHHSPGLIMDAKGDLEDGGRFAFHLTRVEPDVKAVKITLSEIS